MEMKSDKLHKCLKHTFILLVIIVFAYFLLGELFLPSDNEINNINICSEYKGQWEHITADGKKEKINIPGKCRAARNETVVFQTTLPKKIDGIQYLCFRSAKQDMNFYIDGIKRLQYSTRDKRAFGKLSPAAYIFLKVKESDADKTLRIETRTDSAYSGIMYRVYYGNQLGIWSLFCKKYGLELIVAFITLLLSMIAIVGSMAARICYHKKIALEYLGWGILFAAVWLITNSAFRQLIFKNLSVINDITFLMIMLLALPFLMYMDEIQNRRYIKVYRGLECIITINFFVCSAMHIFEIYDFTDTITYVSAFCILSIIVMIATIILDIIKGYVREYIFVATGMFVVCIAAFIQIIIYFQKINIFNGIILSIGLIVLLLFSTLSTIYEIVDMDRKKQQAIMASEAKGRFLANISHEIRTPIHAVLGMDEMILRESREDNIKEYAMDIQNAGQTLLSLINDILDISKIESGKLEIIPVDYDFSSLIHDVMNMMQMKAKDKDLLFLLNVDEKIPSRMLGDDVRIRQVLVNIINNAIKYTEHGSVTLDVKADIEGDMAAVTFSVEDTGIGIKKEDMQKLFAEFERIEEEKNRKIEGTGLGMSITIQLLQMMGSRLMVDSEYGKGSRFSFTLMQKIVNSEPVGTLGKRIKNREKYSYHVMFTAPDAKILIVDDNAVNRKVFVSLLKSTKMQVDEAAGGEQCLEFVREKKYDIIFMDHMMPELDGIQTLHKMREWDEYPCRDTPVIALTANAVSGARDMYMKEGFKGFLSKPVRPQKMEKLIMEMLPDDKVIYQEEDNIQNDDKVKVQSGISYTDTDISDAEELPELDGIDWKYAKIYCRDNEVLLDTVNQFYKMIESDSEALQKMYEALDEGASTSESGGMEERFKDYRIRVHAMKNSAAMIGAVPVSGVARMLEYAARDKRIEPIKNITLYFLEQWDSLKEILKPVIKEDEKASKKFDFDVIKDILNILKNAIKELDVDTADEIVKQLESFEYPYEIMKEAVKNISLAVVDLDEEKTLSWCEKLEGYCSDAGVSASE